MRIDRESTISLNPVFDAEIRRRLWWQIVLLDTRSGQQVSNDTGSQIAYSDTKLPLNVNDADLYPDMEEAPLAQSRPTEMVFCLARYTFGDFVRNNWQNLSGGSTANEDQVIDELEHIIEGTILRYCNLTIPLHLLAAIVIRSIICKMRLVIHHPRRYQERGQLPPDEIRDMVFITCLKMLEYDTLAQSMEAMKRFMWHINVHFQLDAFVLLLSECRKRTSGPLADQAWQQINNVYQHHPELVECKNALYAAVGKLALDAWAAREVQLTTELCQEPHVPDYIALLRSQRYQSNISEDTGAPRCTVSVAHEGVYSRNQANVDNHHATTKNHTDGEFDATLTLEDMAADMSPMDWEYWTDLLQNPDMQIGDHGPVFFT